MIYNCHTVANAVYQAGYEPVFLDVTDDLRLDMEDLKRKASGLSAIVVTHLFGIMNDVKGIKESYPHLVIIEDCAHAYGIEGLYGDFATFSIGQGKPLSIGDGGILLALNSRYLQKLEDLYEELPDYSRSQSMVLFLKLMGRSFMYRPWIYSWLTLPLKRKRTVRSGKETISPRKMCRGIRNIYAVEKDKVKPHSPFMRVLYCQDPKEEQEAYKNQGIDTDTHFAHCIDWAKEFGYKMSQCSNAENLVKHLLMVPTYFER